MTKVDNDLIGKSVLVVDDDEELAETISEQLQDIGLDVVGVANDGNTALKLVDELDPSLIILDIKMPDMDGIEVARRINESEPRPILFLSAYSDTDSIRRAKDTGVFTYLVKPVRVENLIPSIVLTLDRFREMISLKAAVDDMRESISNTDMMEKARSIIMRMKNVTEHEAFTEIKARSHEENKPLADVAADIVRANATGI